MSRIICSTANVWQNAAEGGIIVLHLGKDGHIGVFWRHVVQQICGGARRMADRLYYILGKIAIENVLGENAAQMNCGGEM